MDQAFIEKCDGMANRLMRLHQYLEKQGEDKSYDHSLAYGLEERIGSYLPLSGDFDLAERLLDKYKALPELSSK